jgi:8-oxo-dGTP pyrophosphatase MutT (NUDIX family)
VLRRVDDGSWSFHGGAQRPGERLDQTAWQRVYEETAYRCGSVGKVLMRRVRDGIDDFSLASMASMMPGRGWTRRT